MIASGVVSKSFLHLFYYFITICIFAYFIGKFVQNLSFPFIHRFDTPWLDVFTNNKDTDFIVIDAVVDLNGDVAYLYQGIFSDFAADDERASWR